MSGREGEWGHLSEDWLRRESDEWTRDRSLSLLRFYTPFHDPSIFPLKLFSITCFLRCLFHELPSSLPLFFSLRLFFFSSSKLLSHMLVVFRLCFYHPPAISSARRLPRLFTSQLYAILVEPEQGPPALRMLCFLVLRELLPSRCVVCVRCILYLWMINYALCVCGVFVCMPGLCT